METPTEAPFVSSSMAGILIMVHEESRGLQAESDYIIKVQARRISKASMHNRLEFASQPSSDDIQQWRYKMHSSSDVRKEPAVWYVRKDVETPGGEFLFVDCEIKVTEFAEADLAAATRIVESIKSTR
jgi:hypothetical protein